MQIDAAPAMPPCSAPHKVRDPQGGPTSRPAVVQVPAVCTSPGVADPQMPFMSAIAKAQLTQLVYSSLTLSKRRLGVLT